MLWNALLITFLNITYILYKYDEWTERAVGQKVWFFSNLLVVGALAVSVAGVRWCMQVPLVPEFLPAMISLIGQEPPRNSPEGVIDGV